MRMKYIVTERTDTNNQRIEEIFVFDVNINHDCFGELVGKFKNSTWGRWERVRRTPISAGFVEIRPNDGTMFCYGESETLKLKSRGDEDTKLLTGV